MSRKKKLQKARDKADMMKRRTVLEDGTVILEGRYLLLPNGHLRDIKNELDKLRAFEKVKEVLRNQIKQGADNAS